ncbi:MAG: N-acetylmuramoyl-L-alanine amidase [Spirochaetes bacterium]|nr:N-acetylmuramoyl-L-alanine amidase [Spirochaetota bacterium]
MKLDKKLKNKVFYFFIFSLFLILLINNLNINSFSEEEVLIPDIIKNNLVNDYFNFNFILKSFDLSFIYNYEDFCFDIKNKDTNLTLRINNRKNISIYKYIFKTFSEPLIIIINDKENNNQEEKNNFNLNKNIDFKIFINSDIVYYYYKIFFIPKNYKDEFDKWFQYKKYLKELKLLNYKPIESYTENIFDLNKVEKEKIEEDNKKDNIIKEEIEKKKQDENVVKNYYDFAKKEIFEYKRLKYIIIDPGHGGKDPGAIYGNIKEKDVNLYISNILFSELNKKYSDFIILMTRKDDRYISLEDRVKFINNYNTKEYTGLMISIHCNSNPLSNKSNGLEVYYLDYNIADSKIKDLVSTENNLGTNNSKEDLNYFINRILNENLIYASNFFAKTFYEIYKNKKPVILPNKLAGAPFYVIAYSEIPSILIELGYLTNQNDLKNLLSKKFIDDFISSILEAIDIFIKNYNDTKGFKK